MEEPPDCKYKTICKWYANDCYEKTCWRATALNDYIDLNKLETIIYNGNKQTKSNGLRLNCSERSNRDETKTG